MHHALSKMVLLPIPKVVHAARVTAPRPGLIILMVCFARRQQILAVSMHHALSKMVLLSIRVIVRAARVIVIHQLDCSVWLQ